MRHCLLLSGKDVCGVHRIGKGAPVEFFKWKDSFKIGIEELDLQHRTFLEYLNECYTDSAAGNHTKVDSAMIAKLRQYATVHFRREEELLRFVNYPDMERQEKQHIYFEQQILSLEAERDAGRPRDVEEVFTFLRDWFLNHILEEDKRFVPLVKQGRFDTK
jgi:hemerythrin